MALFSKTEVLLNISQIEEVEKIIGLNFPKEYKEHLIKHNGGLCKPNIFRFKEKGEFTESCVDWFLAIYDGEYDNLINYINIYKIEEKRLPKHILPIAHDPGGNLICISCDGNDIGYIYFWNHENEIDTKNVKDNDYSNLILIAKGFNEFICGLRE